MKTSLLPIGNGNSLSLLLANKNDSESFNRETIPTIQEWHQSNIVSDQSFTVIYDDDLLLKNIVVYHTGSEPNKKINFVLSQGTTVLLNSDLSLSSPTDLTNLFYWDFPHGVILTPERSLLVTPNFPIQSFILSTALIHRESKTLSLSN